MVRYATQKYLVVQIIKIFMLSSRLAFELNYFLGLNSVLLTVTESTLLRE